MKKLFILSSILIYSISVWSQDENDSSGQGWFVYDGYSYTDEGCDSGSYDFWIEFDLSDQADGYDPRFINFKKSFYKTYIEFDTRFGGYSGMERVCINPRSKIISLNFSEKKPKRLGDYDCSEADTRKGQYNLCSSYFFRPVNDNATLRNSIYCLISLCTANLSGEIPIKREFSSSELYRAVRELDLVKEAEFLYAQSQQTRLERKQKRLDEEKRKADEKKRIQEELTNRIKEQKDIIEERLVNRNKTAILTPSIFNYFSDTQKFLGSEVLQPSELEIQSDIQVNGLRIRTSKDISAKCASGESLYVELDGSINPDTSEVIERLFKKMTPCQREDLQFPDPIKIYLNSSGGYVEDGFKLGRMFRSFNVEVSLLEGQECYSSCAFAFLGGLTRSMDKTSSVIMFHAPYLPKADFASTGNVACSDMGTSLKDYFIEMIGDDSGEFLFKRTMSYCGADKGWYINKDAADIFEITNF